MLQSVPVDKEGDKQLIDELKLYLQWNTNTAYLKDLPKWYDNPSLDLFEELDKIKAAIQDDTYQSEWEVQSAITALFAGTGDNHIYWGADINAVMTFGRPVSLVSVSTDGKSAPEVFVYVNLLWNGEYNFSASSVEQINGEDIATYLYKVSRQTTYHDAHARYNALFPNQAGSSLKGPILGYSANGIYDGPNTTYTFSNGTTRTTENLALLQKNFTGVDSGASFFSNFCQPSPSSVPTPSSSIPLATPTSTTSSAPQATNTKAFGYPPAVLLHPANAIGGYYLNGSDDVAVLSMPTFEPVYEAPEYGVQALDDFQTVAREFLKQAAADEKSKLIIDLRYNGGGNTVLGFDLFKLIFPNLEPYQATRRHAHQAYEQLVDLTTDFSQDLLALAASPNISQADAIALSPLTEFLYSLETRPNGSDFENAGQFYGPHVFNNDNFTSLRSWNLSNTIGLASNFTVSGYGASLATQQPAWNASNIVLLQDGFCSSTCAIFSELMYTLAGVQTIVVGGLPDDSTPMQKVGGTKGWLTWTKESLASFPSSFYYFANQSVIAAAEGTEINALNQSSAVLARARAMQVNAADGIRRGDEERQTPLQFVFEAAECRVWYTVPMVFDVTETWKAVANVKWRNGSCNAGAGFAGNQTQPVGAPYTNGAQEVRATGFALVGMVIVLLTLV
ncbi:hypothetical protein EKO04_002133 [Ascochyta lentis]|uniref:Tail specific protease domain-containing protein n=1 Tax=Ascochyta lentis TaxID=205686 RepID=A0A8H7MK78_9PLEO|nr:hypothetical protein EKO04_002133 [Ascochyta lentis]